MRIGFLIVCLALLTAVLAAQDSAAKAPAGTASSGRSTAEKSSSNQPTGSAQTEEESSSRDTRIDLSAPKDDAKEHPDSKAAAADLEGSDAPDNTGVQEFHPWNPMKAVKDIEVGDFYYKRKNYRAALDRYKEALYYKDGDAVANFRMAECEEKLGNKAEARNHYEQYLKILPAGPFAKEARAALDKLGKSE